MISNAQSGPFSWWENIKAPAATTWEGTHPSGGGGSCPHMWGQSSATKVLVEAIIAEFYDGRVLIGRGMPTEWLEQGISADNFPVTGNKRMGITVKAVAQRQVRLDISGDQPSGNIVFSLSVFVNNIASATAGTIDKAGGTVTINPSVRTVPVTTLSDLPVSATPSRHTAPSSRSGSYFCVRNNHLVINPRQSSPLSLPTVRLFTPQGRLAASFAVTDQYHARGFSLEGLAAGNCIIELRHANDLVNNTMWSGSDGNNRRDFVGWGGCGPVALLIENGIGVRVDAAQRKILWRIARPDRHGVENLQFSDNKVTLLSTSRINKAELPKLTITAEKPFTLMVHINDRTFQKNVPEGTLEWELSEATSIWTEKYKKFQPRTFQQQLRIHIKTDHNIQVDKRLFNLRGQTVQDNLKVNLSKCAIIHNTQAGNIK
ncbi:MAG: hypothetical protein GF398_20010 [Chitinivibrionales bacterium]|nr:hypothetical protein [Chitinivibrionales bacterium]